MPAPRNIKLTSVRKPKANKRRIKMKKRILRSVLNAARSARFERNCRNSNTESPERQTKPPAPIDKHALPSGLPWPIAMVPVRNLTPAVRNPRAHTKTQISRIVESIRQFGYIDPVLADENLNIIGGHARAEAAERAGLRTIPVIIRAGLSDTEKRALALADNKIAELGGWLRSDLAVELSELAPLLEEAGLDIELTGFQPFELDALMGDLVDPEREPAEEPVIAGEPVSRRGDMWQLGPHRILCGDATNTDDLHNLMGRERAAMMFTDPPYNVKIKSVQGRGKIKHREFAQGSGEMPRAQFTKFLVDSLSLAAAHSTDGSIHFVCMDWRHSRELQDAGEKVYTELKNVVVWVKTNSGMGTFYRSQHELVFVFKNGEAKHTNNFLLGQNGRNRSNVWSYAGANTFRAGRMEELALHPTAKPVALVADAVRDCSRRGDIVLDPFAGSGTTILAAERVGRRSYGLEIDPLYVDVAIRRWENFTKRDAVLKTTRQTFDEVADERASAQARRLK